MASDGCDPPIPPLAKSDKEKGKKKSYMVKLLNRFNNVTASSSQPSTPTSTSTARFVPPPLQVPSLTPTPPSIPPLLEVPAFTPSPQQFVADQWRSPSPHVGSNPTTHSPHVGSNPTTPTNMPSPPPIGDNPPHSSSVANDFEDVSNNLPIITPIGGRFYPTKTASKAITATIKQQFDEPWVTWGQIPQTQRNVFFERFKRKVSWRSNHEEKSQELGRSVHVDEIFQQTHIRASTGEFVDERSRQTHSQELGRSVHVNEIFQQTYIRASTGEFVDERSRRTHEEFEAKFSQIRYETAFVGASTCAPLDPVDEERLRNQCWLDFAGGRYKGRVYGIGNVSAQDDCVDSYISLRMSVLKMSMPIT
ncbi:hypothetical protein LR48_Vigan10g177700 [Vigna angularis]|uniref:Uncharacterized protein n=1 Tax=Phaseolus angularis TaxID=3914 RepID=A0A0L9VLG5_PHAAN|nr:hypothetical protein LR48_Vigan10g177700 [Vigna angularis]